MSRLDLCPRCGGILHMTTHTRTSWRARCLSCRRYSHLDDQYDTWVAGYGWGVWLVGVFWLALILFAAWLESNGWA